MQPDNSGHQVRMARGAAGSGAATGATGSFGALLVAAVLLLSNPAIGSAALIVEPVFNHVPGVGGGPDLLPFPFLGVVNGATGLPFITADEPGEIVTYPAGFPADPVLANTLRFYNDTAYDITSFTLSIIGLADDGVSGGDRRHVRRRLWRPEPGAWVLLGTGILGAWRRLRRREARPARMISTYLRQAR